MNAPDFAGFLAEAGTPMLSRRPVSTLQLNIGRRCDLACHHCHVEAGPNRSENMVRATADRVLTVLAASPGVELLDITGGAPELNDNFERVVAGARALGRRVLDRCNLTVLFEPGRAGTAEFLAENGVEVVASLPCYTAENVEAQRGRGVFGRSIEALQLLNRLGYGRPGSSLRLDLVYNPQGASLPPPQKELAARYRDELRRLFGIEFHDLLTITNMPIKRFARDLERRGEHADYMCLLVNHFNPSTLGSLMCRDLVSVSWDGRLYDCDFNQMLEIDLARSAILAGVNERGERTRSGLSIWDIDDLADLEGARIATGSHCFACTAGAGSSCGGALT